jgi:TonB family protein
VLLEFLVTEHGEVSNVVVIKASADGLAKKAVETVQKWKFRPGTSKEGKAVAARIQTQVGFHRY